MREGRSLGFQVHLLYICLNTPERNIVRVQHRVSLGGHNVSDEDVRRRYHRSLKNLTAAILLADKSTIYDNSEGCRAKLMEFEGGLLVWRTSWEPSWAAPLFENSALLEPK